MWVCALALGLALGLPISSGTAQEAPPPPKPAVKLLFLPPPMEGSISMGIFNSTGKLIRTLHCEAEVDGDAFFKEINGLVTFWDGKDDAGNLMPAGKYSARGFRVGELQIEGEAFHCNDWASDGDSPRIRRITKLGAFTDSILLEAQLANDQRAQLRCEASGTLTLVPEVAADQAEPEKNPNSNDRNVIASCPGRNETLWVIDRAPDGVTEVKQFSQSGEFLRRLSIDPTQPQPVKIAASTTRDAICLLEENAQCQRFRWLELTQADPTVSTWSEVLSKTVTYSDQFEKVQAILKMPNGKPATAQNPLGIRLVPNPLLQDKAIPLDIKLGIDPQGSFIQTADGLILKRITGTPNLKWAIMARDPGSKVIVVFQGDGAAVEEYRIGAIANMMGFDYGEFQFNPAK